MGRVRSHTLILDIAARHLYVTATLSRSSSGNTNNNSSRAKPVVARRTPSRYKLITYRPLISVKSGYQTHFNQVLNLRDFFCDPFYSGQMEVLIEIHYLRVPHLSPVMPPENHLCYTFCGIHLLTPDLRGRAALLIP